MALTCRLCGKGANEIGGYLHRVNEKGVPGTWECRPICRVQMSPEDRIAAAIAGESDDDAEAVSIQESV